MTLLGGGEKELKFEMNLGKLIKYERLVCLSKFQIQLRFYLDLR